MSLAEGLSSKWLSVSAPSPHVLHIRLNRKPVNAFCVEFWRAYGALFDRIVDEGRDVRAAVVSSAMPKIFTAGIDLSDAVKLNTGELIGGLSIDPARNALDSLPFIKSFQRAIGAPERCPFPVIVAVHGPVLGLGVDIICACDIRYATETAEFSIKEVDVGLAADIGTLAYLPKIAGNQSLVREFAYTGATFSAVDAERAGIISRVVPGGAAEVVAAALGLAAEIARKSPVAVAGTKRILTHARDHGVQENLDYTALWNAAALQTEDISESLRAAKAKSVAKYHPLHKSKL
ncbi:Delta2-dienoyl-CoA-isomerase [Roridomyces roridus]|uniref:Delta2-dienoyl-CoA-isomerase n=1 Tax=Roridomyces roridus TaxID=1738132 RepID=A0AAD7AZI6_9AGAR|nr:Delta2-dienoyl-CoA-isomerase [Roridomyces roridus]